MIQSRPVCRLSTYLIQHSFSLKKGEIRMAAKSPHDLDPRAEKTLT